MRMSSQLVLETGGEWSKAFLFQLSHTNELHQGHIPNPRERLPTKDFLVRQKGHTPQYSISDGHSVPCKFCIAIE